MIQYQALDGNGQNVIRRRSPSPYSACPGRTMIEGGTIKCTPFSQKLHSRPDRAHTICQSIDNDAYTERRKRQRTMPASSARDAKET